jgi:hypothetical protein
MTGLTHRNWFNTLKWLTYGLLLINVGLFLQEEMLAVEYTFGDGLTLVDTIQAFAATIDTAAWVILLLLFELETSILPDEKIKGLTKWSMHGVRAICYLFIVYAFYGYLVELMMFYQVTPLPVADACALLGADWSLVVTIDEYTQLTDSNCSSLGAELWRLESFKVVTDAANLKIVQNLAWTDVFNSAAWILVVVVLEADVLLQLRGKLEGRILLFSKLCKCILYPVLLLAAVYWWIDGDFLDFWDAFLWLFAFIFIELNIFDWQAETHVEREAGQKVQAGHA